VAAVDHHDEARLLAGEAILDDHTRAGFAQRMSDEHPVDCRVRFLARRRHDDALPCGQPVGLDDDRRTAAVDIRMRGADIGERLVCGRRNAVPRHERLGVILRAFELRRSACWTEDLQAGSAKCVDDAGGERCLGTDDGERHRLASRELNERGDLGQRDVREARLSCRAGVAGRHEHLRDAGRLRDLPRERVLATAAADHQDVHFLVEREATHDIERAAVIDPAVERRNVRHHHRRLLHAHRCDGQDRGKRKSV
jgi:hypothetical protein